MKEFTEEKIYTKDEPMDRVAFRRFVRRYKKDMDEYNSLPRKNRENVAAVAQRCFLYEREGVSVYLRLLPEWADDNRDQVSLYSYFLDHKDDELVNRAMKSDLKLVLQEHCSTPRGRKVKTIAVNEGITEFHLKQCANIIQSNYRLWEMNNTYPKVS